MVAGIDTPAGYTRLDRVRTGADADVYQAWDERAGRWAMLRLFHRFVAGRAEEAAFATHVAASLGLVGNASIVPVRAGGITATGRPWLALDRAEGRLLSEVLRDGPPPAEALRLVTLLADALAWAHSLRPPMLHGRIRAEHVIVSPAGIPMITDFSAPRPPGAPVPRPSGDVTDLAALLFHALTGNSWPGRGEPDDRAIAAWPGLTGLLDEVLTPVPAIDSMAVFAARLRQVWHAADAADPLPAAPPGEITPAAPAEMHEPEMHRPEGYAGKRHLSMLALVALLPLGYGAVQLFPDKAVVPPLCATTADGDAGSAVLWWPADEGTGTTVCDFSGSGNRATLSTGAGWSSAGAAMRFTAEAAGGHASGLAPAVRTDGSFTVMAWVNLGDTDGTHGVLSQPGTVSSGFILKYERASDSWRLTMPQTDSRSPVVDGATSTTRPRIDTWTHLAASFDTATRKVTIFVDGVAEDSADHPVSWNATGPVQAGRTWYDGAWSERFHGAIDDVRAYRAALPEAGIAEIAASGRDEHPAPADGH
ncbi:LamG-like jellyroll fold domain-containing protein [Actinoplanes xinjiangensis]|uniref:LamG-like jellyroll fold domain-containing protein n=1 Tax=Actinoplanes xinjiangensis TaxID=512350 RepID=UPI00344565F7